MNPTPDKNNKRRVAAYCRVSTDQEEQADSFENQVRTYEETIRSNPEWEFAGIYTDEGISGTRADRRAGFLQMIDDCKAGKIDHILTKSISRFARNVVDSLSYIRQLREMGVSVYFEEEHILSSDHGAEMIFTILAATAEQESRNISENTKWGIRSRFRQGIYRNPAQLKLYGFDSDKNGKVIIREDEAKTVRFIYQSYLEGMIPNAIAQHLSSIGISNRKGTIWSAGLILSILTNEKYKGDVTLQKSYVKDFISHKSVRNQGELQQYHLRRAHPAIIDEDQWEAVRLEKERRSHLVDPFGQPIVMNSKNPYTGKIFYQEGCQALLSCTSYRKNTRSGATWKCRWYKKGFPPVCRNPNHSAEGSPGVPCQGFPVNAYIIRSFFLTAWNDMAEDQIAARRKQWTATMNNTDANPLARVRAQQMLKLTAAGTDAKLQEDIPEIVRMVLDKIIIQDPRHACVVFLDGTTRQVDLGSEWYAGAGEKGGKP